AQREIGEWLHENLPANYTVAEIATGIVPYYSRLPTIDMLGVNDEHIAHLDIPLGSAPSGHEKSDAGYVLSRKPEVIWLGLDLEGTPKYTTAAYPAPACVLGERAVYAATVCNPYLWVFYRPVAVRLQHGWFNILVRGDVHLELPPGSIDRGAPPAGQ
ncbi:MAG TPA: hypothetical protein VFY79_11590, partial [Dehalococcoidia bacterium]|nr:hypothetical protein [Dehalococcoidia bacterium]